MFDSKQFIINSYKLIINALDTSMHMNKFISKLKALINTYTDLKRDERLWLYQAVLKLYRKLRYRIDDGEYKNLLFRKVNYDTLLQVSRKAATVRDIRVKQDAYFRSREAGYIFYICSVHDHPGEDHKNLQGKIYYTKAWRLYVKPELYYNVLHYIHNHEGQLMTVEEVTGKPYWLTTRPYCKHKLIAVPTEQVLGTSLNILRRQYLNQIREIYSDYDYDRFKMSIVEELKSTVLNKDIG